MSERNDGGPAFPFGQVSEASGMPINGYHNDGMSLRDYFAAKAMPALTEDAIWRMREKSVQKSPERTGMDDAEWDDSRRSWADGIASEAYIIADAMLRAREVKQ